MPPLLFEGDNIDAGLRGFVTLCSRIEVFAVLVGTRDVCCISLREADVPEVRDWCRHHGLAAEISRRRYVPVREPAKAGYSNIASFDIDPSDIVYTDLMVSRNPEYSQLAAACQENGRIFATMLGYPMCCIDFFVYWYARRADRDNDYILPCIQSFKPFSFLNNSQLSYFDISLMSHFPCSPECEATSRISSENLRALQQHAPALASTLETHLKSVVIYTERQGIAYSHDYEVRGNTIRLGQVYTVQGTLMEQLLEDCREVEVRSHGSFTIGGRLFNRNCRIAIFR
ncbi:MAG: hypothetical protein HGA97_06385 [Chlorobiaceae bacterium]|nr:hypothetical protein [Chlorobiaceae bacterium]